VKAKNPRADFTVVILDEDKETPIDLLAVIEIKNYDYDTNSIGIKKIGNVYHNIHKSMKLGQRT